MLLYPRYPKIAFSIGGVLFVRSTFIVGPPRVRRVRDPICLKRPDKTVVAWPLITSKRKYSGGRKYVKVLLSCHAPAPYPLLPA